MESDFVRSKDFRTRVLRIVSPIQGLDPKRFGSIPAVSKSDPGFRVLLPGDDRELPPLRSISRSDYWNLLGRALSANLQERHVEYSVHFQDDPKLRRLRVALRSAISQGWRADIRFFPKRKGVFKAQGINGQQAWTWVRENHGVAVIDHGFRIKPFGFPEDDWLKLDVDGAHNRREWRSEIATEHIPINPKEKSDPALNPGLNLPSNVQLVGAVLWSPALLLYPPRAWTSRRQ